MPYFMSDVIDSSLGKDGDIVASAEMQVHEEKHVLLVSPEVAEENNVTSCTEVAEPSRLRIVKTHDVHGQLMTLRCGSKNPRGIPSALHDNVSNDDFVGKVGDVGEDD